jgi:transposase-like protein
MYIRKMARNQKVAYLHLPEAAPKNETEEKITGKYQRYQCQDCGGWQQQRRSEPIAAEILKPS